MRADEKIVPGRYALDGDGTWHLFTDKAELAFKPVAVMKVKAPIAVDEPVATTVDVAAEPMAQLAAFGETLDGAPARVSEPTQRMGATLGAPFKLGISRAPGSPANRAAQSRRSPVEPSMAAQSRLSPIDPRSAAQARRDVPDTRRTATPGDVVRAIGEQFGILPTMGARVSAARFKPMGQRDPDADAARDYERSVRERQSRD